MKLKKVLYAFLQRSFSEAEEAGAEAIILRLIHRVALWMRHGKLQVNG